MNIVTLEIILILILIITNGIFSLSEMAVISARKTRLQERIQKGDQRAKVALDLANSPSRFLSTVQIGITLVGILAGALGGATIANLMAEKISQIKFLAPYSEIISISIVVMVITYLSLVFGELVPKRLAMNSPEKIASRMAPSMRTISKIVSPVVSLLSRSTEGVLRILGLKGTSEQPVTEEEIKLLIEQGAKTGVFELSEQEMVNRVFRLGDRKVNALMTPRPEIIWLDINEPIKKIQETILSSGHSCFPVAQDNLDNLLGIVLAKDLLSQSLSGSPFDIKSIMLPAKFVPEGTPALEVLERFKETRSHVALVIDEYGGLQGLVTTSDILSAVVGEIPLPDEKEEAEIVQRADGSWLVDGKLQIDEFKDLFKMNKLPLEEEGNYQTMGGFVMTFLGRIPSVGDNFEWENFQFEVVDMDGRRVDKVLVTLSSNKLEKAQ
jgi:putative hemolysin